MDGDPVETKNAGYTGTGYANALNQVGSSIIWSVEATSSISATLSFQFANGGDAARPANLLINDGSNGSYSISLPVTGAWTTWQSQSITVELVQGTNIIELTSTNDEGLANIDYLNVTGVGVSAGSCDDVIPTGSSDGYISITDPVPGWASQGGGTTGGGTDLSKAVTVSSMSALQSAVSGSSSKIVLVTPGTYTGALQPGSNTTIIGTAPGVTIKGYVKVSGSDVSNVIVRNIAVRGESCSTYEECKAGDDAVYIGNEAHHVWFDHVDVADGQDGNFDITQGGDYVTVSWSHFHYTYDKPHRFSNLIAGSDSESKSVGKLRITYMNSWWGDRVVQRQPRGRFGKVHLLNNLHSSKVVTATDDGGTHAQIVHGPGVDISMVIEGCYYDIPSSISPVHATYSGPEDTDGWVAFNNEGTAQDMNTSYGTPFTVPYSYTPMPASQVQAAVTSATCGASNNCTLQQ